MNEENNNLKYDPVCVVELLLHEEKCIYENGRLSGFESLKHMSFEHTCTECCVCFSASITEQCP